jgi:hyperosmotically inducible protein
MAADAALTAKIKSKMALDDTVEAASINVDTTGQTVTLTGAVDSPEQRVRALLLARETDGVATVVDHLTVR